MRYNSSAQQYNDWRGVLFKNCESSKAIKLLMACQSLTSKTTYNGLRAELLFYKTYVRMFWLSVGLDANDHCDFSGVVKGRPARIDVTNRKGFEEKKKQKIENEVVRFTGWDYYIACFEKDHFDFYKLNVNHHCFDLIIIAPMMTISIPKLECCRVDIEQADKLTRRIYNAHEHVRRTITSAIHSRNACDVLRMFASENRIDSRLQGCDVKYFQDCIQELDSIPPDQRLDIEAQVRFYLNYKDILHLTATLSNLGPQYDFAGLQDGCPTRYRIIQNTSSIKPDSYLASIQEGWSYKLVRYCRSSGVFEIFDLHDFTKYEVPI